MSAAREENIERIADLFSDVMRGVFSWRTHSFPTDVTLGELRCMMAVGRLGTPTMSDLSERLQLSPSTVTALVDDLVQHGWAEREVDAKDRRVVRVALTDKGKRLRREKRRARRQRLLEALTDLEDEQLERVVDALELLHDVTRKGKRRSCAGAR